MGKKFSAIAIAIAALSFGFTPRSNADVGELPPAPEPHQSYNYAPPQPHVYYPPPPPVRVVVYPTYGFFGPWVGFYPHHYYYGNHWSGRRVYHRAYHHWR